MIQRVIARTDEGKLNWVKGASSYQFVASVSDYILSFSDVGENDLEVFEFQLLNDEGSPIDSFRVDKTEWDFSMYVSFFNRVKFQALGVLRAIADISKTLDDLEGN
jgi:hypothetical protein